MVAGTPILRCFQVRLDEKLQYDDLSDATGRDKTSLVIHQKKRYLSGPLPEVIFDGVRPDEVSPFRVPRPPARQPAPPTH